MCQRQKIVFIFIWFLLSGSLVYSESLINRLRVPITIKGKIGIGYDNNILRFSEKEIQDNNVKAEGISLTLDSPILKPGIKFIYSPTFLDGKTTNIVTSISYSHYVQEVNKSYLISNLSLEIKLRSYSWIKVGIRDIPKYYLRNYHDRDLSVQDYFSCTFDGVLYV